LRSAAERLLSFEKRSSTSDGMMQQWHAMKTSIVLRVETACGKRKIAVRRGIIRTAEEQ
jgi:hypothetical protein